MTNLFDRANPEGIYPALTRLEADLRLPEGFCDALFNEDDWSFIIKLHAVLEAALTSLLVARFGDDRLGETFSQLEMSNGNSGKIAFAEALGLLDKAERRFVRKLSELRNTLVHRIGNVTFTLDAHIGSIDSAQRKSFAESFSLGNDTPDRNEYAAKQSKMYLWRGGVMLLATIELQTEIARHQYRADALSRELSEHVTELQSLFAQVQSTGEEPHGGRSPEQM